MVGVLPIALAMPRTALQLETPAGGRPGVFNVLELGVVPGTSVASTAALQRVIDDCAAAGGGTVLFPPEFI